MRREPLRGRNDERAELVALLDAAAGGRGGVAVLSGPPGIGKSALAETIAEEAERRGLPVRRGRAWEFADAPPYFPVTAPLEALGVDPAAEPTAFKLWETTLRALSRATRPPATATVWLLEDLHAADLLTLDLLVFLAQPLRSLPALVLVTTRDADPRIDDRVAGRLARLAREGLDLRLPPLSSEQVAGVAEQWLGRPLSDGERAELARRTEGNPLFAVEIARALSAGRGATLETTVPSTIRQLVLSRYERLPEAARRALAAGAVLGREFGAGTAARMLSVLPARLVDDLRPALQSGLVTESSPGQFVFGHVLERDAIEDALPASIRAELHAAAEEALALAGDAPEILLERVRHALESGRVDEEARVIALAEHAASVLLGRGAFDRVLGVYARLDEARRTGVVLRPAAARELLHRADVAHRAGRSAECRRLCALVVDGARRSGDAADLGRAALLFGAELRPGVVDRSLVALLEEAVSRVGGSDEALACRLEARLVAAQQPSPEPMVLAARASTIIDRARASGDPALALDVLVTAGSAIVDYSPLPERIALWREQVDRAERAGDHEKLLRGWARLAMDSLEVGDEQSFHRGVTQMLDLSTELGHPRHRWRPLLFASMQASMFGRFDESERFIVEVEQVAALTDEPSLTLCLDAHRTLRGRDVLDADALRERVRDIRRILPDVPGVELLAAIMNAALLARVGDVPHLEAELRKLEPYMAVALSDNAFSVLTAEAVAVAGTDTLRRTLLARLAPLVEQDCVTGHVPMTYEGPVARTVGLLEASLGDVDRSIGHLRSALERVRACGFLPWVARISVELSRVLALSGREDEAARLEREGRALARRLGMPLLAGPGPDAALAEAPPEPTATKETFTMTRDGDTWRVGVGARQARVRDSRGMQLLARLVEQPGREVHVLVLASDEGSATVEGDAGETLDATALRQYRARLAELSAEIDRADEHNDRGRAARLRAEQAALEGEIRGAVGLGGKARRAGSVTERARVNVQRRLKDAVARIAEADAALGAVLARAVRTGTYCAFHA